MEKVWKINYLSKLGEMEWSWNGNEMEHFKIIYSMKSGMEMVWKWKGN